MVLDMEADFFRFLSLPPYFEPVDTTWHRHFGAVTFLGEAEGITVELPCHIPVFNQQPDMIDVVGDTAGGHELALAGGHLTAGHVLNDLNGESGRLEELETQIALFVL